MDVRERRERKETTGDGKDKRKVRERKKEPDNPR